MLQITRHVPGTGGTKPGPMRKMRQTLAGAAKRHSA